MTLCLHGTPWVLRASAPSTPGQHVGVMKERSVDTRIEVYWSCPPCEVEGQDAQPVSGEPSCWNCGGPVVVTARPTVRASTSPDTP
jgi:hypothetical protein